MQNTSNSNPISPQISATVSASAGTGKTWMLVSRIIRLLLDGTSPDSILAITFTRKAAAEMQTRLSARLLEFATCDEQTLVQHLEQISAQTDPLNLNKARWLYEDLLQSNQNVRTATFHAFCQEILRRFPLEADVAPGFDLIESTTDLVTTAWDLLNQELTELPNSEAALELERLFNYCGTLSNTQTALFSFLHHRSDWWSYHQDQPNPIAYASEQLQKTLKITPCHSPIKAFFSAENRNRLAEFMDLLQRHPTKSNQTFIHHLSNALAALNGERLNDKQFETTYHDVGQVFLTQKGETRSRKHSKTLAAKMGVNGVDRFLELHEALSESLISTNETLKRIKLFYATCAWYKVGHKLLHIFQELKNEQRLLDFTDLEWKTYKLLNHSDNAHWIQYKLDQRINHLLIDEFQDTNPTQWQLIVPLLEELASTRDQNRNRSIFLVGDKKQSIYRFRRAAPELFDTAQDWISQRLDGLSQTLSTSRRSAPAIIQCINHIFEDGDLNQQIHDFQTHQTHHEQLWGHVELLPLLIKQQNGTDLDTENPHIENQDTENHGTENHGTENHGTENHEQAILRNPLLQARMILQDTRHLDEGRQIAAKIQKLISQGLNVTIDGVSRAIEYGDIMILVRHRTHTQSFEQALREASIPYLSAQKGTLLECLEVRDIIALLEFIVAPYNNLALATVLRSPIFSCSNNDLIRIAQLEKSNWMDKLHLLCRDNGLEISQNLHQAWSLLTKWISLAGSIPVHDLLDTIYTDANLLNRYQAAYPAHLQQRVQANLTRFIELALEIDSGRYPSIGNFLARLNLLRTTDVDGPDEGSIDAANSKVNILTIHASKGMEAPIVFLADAANTRRPSNAYQTLVHWPAAAVKPSRFLLTPKKDELDQLTQEIVRLEQQADQREEANLLYVAITRARQMLFISGNTNKPELKGWYGIIESQLKTKLKQATAPYILKNGDPLLAHPTVTSTEITSAPVSIDPAILEKQPLMEASIEISPSKSLGLQFSEQSSDKREDEKFLRGQVIHRIIQLLSEALPHTDIISTLHNEFTIPAETQLNNWFEEALTVFQHRDTQWIFNPTQYIKAYNEVPITFIKNSRTVSGVIDRLILKQDEAIIVDYKSHEVTNPDDIQGQTEHYQNQMALYADGVKHSWPEKSVRSFLLFTHSVTLSEC